MATKDQPRTPAPVDENELRLAYHPELDRYINTPLGNLHVFDGWEDHGPAVDAEDLASLNAHAAE